LNGHYVRHKDLLKIVVFGAAYHLQRIMDVKSLDTSTESNNRFDPCCN